MSYLGLLLIAAVAALAVGRSDAADRWSLKTADTQVDIAVMNGRPALTHLGATGDTHNWVGKPFEQPLMKTAAVGGKERTLSWEFTSARRERGGRLVLAYSCAEPALALRSIWRAQAGHGPIEHWIEIDNRSPKRVMITHQDSLSLPGLLLGPSADLWWIRRGAANAVKQGGTYTEPLNARTDLNLKSDCWDGASPVPWLAVQMGSERGLYVGWEFTGLGRISAQGAASISAGLLPDFRTDIDPGETFVVPPAFVGCYKGDVEDGSYCLHRWVIEKLRPPLPKGYPDPSLNCAVYPDGGGPNATEETYMPIPRRFQKLGFEMFMTDAIWFPHVGDWRWDPKRWPHGDTPIEEFVHKHGMKLGLWCAWTNGGLSDDPDALNVRRNADWFSTDFAPDWKPGLFSGGKLCLGCADAKEWAIRKTQWVAKQYKLDYLKHDIMPVVNQCNKTTHRHHYGVDASYWATMGYYEVQEKLMKACPNVALENCSGAGHMKDFGAVRRTHYTATTDTLSNLPDRQSVWDSTFALPPLVLQCYTFERMYKQPGDDPGPFLWRSAMMSAWHIAPNDSGSWTPAELQSAARAVTVYKSWIRPILQDCKVHHVLPRPDGVNWDGLFYWSGKLNKGTLYVFRPASDKGKKTVKLKGLDAQSIYDVWSEDGSITPATLTGAELMDSGLTISLPGQYTSDLIYVERA